MTITFTPDEARALRIAIERSLALAAKSPNIAAILEIDRKTAANATTALQKLPNTESQPKPIW